MNQEKKKWTIGQDWASVVVGFVTIFLILGIGYHIAAPSFGPKSGWTDITFLTTDLLSSARAVQIGATLLLFLAVSVIGIILSGDSVKFYPLGFVIIFGLAVIAQILSSFSGFKTIGLETVLFSLLLGLLIGNLFILPQWLRSGVQTELFVKIGLVLLGATILFGDILSAGALGLIQALIVVPGAWYFAFRVSRKLKLDDEYATLLASAVSICGVSAAIATAGAINGDKKKLSFVISLVLIVAIPMMIFMPVIARWMGLSDEVTGAWLGGTIDTTGAVVGAGTIAGDTGLKYATIIKFSQNVLIGLAAFAISVFWAYRDNNDGPHQRVSLKVIWERFPKFVLGFIAASLIFSFLIDAETAKSAGNMIKSFSSFWFNLAFISIGLETRFSDVAKLESKKPIYSFLIAQAFNIIFTLIIAYFLFGYIRSNF